MKEKVFHGNQSNLKIVSNENLLSRYFPFKNIPHYIWITPEGIIVAITSTVGEVAIKEFIDGKPINLKTKSKLLDYDFKRPLFASGQADPGQDLLSHSIITRYRPDLSGFGSRGNNYISITNNTVVNLFQVAYGKFDLQFFDINRVIVEGMKTELDSASIGYFKPYDRMKKRFDIEKNTYCYELVLPDSVPNEKLFQYMQEDLNRYFKIQGISAHTEKRMTKYISLTRTDDELLKKIEVNGKVKSNYVLANSLQMVDQPIPFFLSQLQPFFNNGVHLEDATKFTGNISLELDGNLGDIHNLNNQLKKYGLRLVESQEKLDMIVITKE